MKTEFKHGVKNNYMILRPEEYLGECIDKNNLFQFKILENNSPDELLKMEMDTFDGEYVLKYVISSMQQLAKMFEYKKIEYETLERIYLTVIKLVNKCANYMLEIGNIILNPEYIYINDKRIQLCYFPGDTKDFYECLRRLTQDLAVRVDHRDRRAVDCIYNILDICNKESYTVSDIENYFKNISEQNSHDNEVLSAENIPGNNESYKNEIVSYKGEDYAGYSSVSQSAYGKYLSIKEVESGEYPEINESKNLTYSGIEAAEYSGVTGLIREKFNEFKIKFFPLNNKACNSEGCETDKSVMGDELYKPDNSENSNKSDNFENNQTTLLRNEGESDGNIYDRIDEEKNKNDDEGIILKYCGDDKNLEDIQLENFPCVIGKSEKYADYVIDYDYISRVQIKIYREEGKYYLEDENSTNGTLLNEVPVDPFRKIRIDKGDEIKLADLKYIVG